MRVEYEKRTRIPNEESAGAGTGHRRRKQRVAVDVEYETRDSKFVKSKYLDKINLLLALITKVINHNAYSFHRKSKRKTWP